MDNNLNLEKNIYQFSIRKIGIFVTFNQSQAFVLQSI